MKRDKRTTMKRDKRTMKRDKRTMKRDKRTMLRDKRTMFNILFKPTQNPPTCKCYHC